MSQLMKRGPIALGLLAAAIAVAWGGASGSYAASARSPFVSAAPRTHPGDLETEINQAIARGDLNAERAVTLMLNAGPQATAKLYRTLKRKASSAQITKALKEVPAVAARVSSLASLSPRDRRHAVATTLEIFIHSPFDIDSAPWLQLLKSSSSLPHEGSLAGRIQAGIQKRHRHHSLGPSELARLIRAAGRSFGTTVVDGAAEAEALMPLAETLHQTTGHEGAILNRVASMIRRGVPVTGEPVCVAALPFLESKNSFERAEAAALFGLIGDRRHVQPLVGRLEDPTPLVRAAALKALKALTGMTISGDAQRWTRWYEDQESWWNAAGASLVGGLSQADRSALVRVLKEVSTRRLYRREISAELVIMLQERPADEVRVAVAALSTLRDPETLPRILELRDHPDLAVRASVADAVVAFRHAGIKPSKVKAMPTR